MPRVSKSTWNSFSCSGGGSSTAILDGTQWVKVHSPSLWNKNTNHWTYRTTFSNICWKKSAIQHILLPVVIKSLRTWMSLNVIKIIFENSILISLFKIIKYRERRVSKQQWISIHNSYMPTCKNNHNNCEQTTTYENEYLLRNSFLTSYFLCMKHQK